MTKELTKKFAEILVKCGYAEKIHPTQSDILLIDESQYYVQKCNPFADTLESRRQADAIEDWLYDYNEDLWEESVHIPDRHKLKCTLREWRLECIKYCGEELCTKK